MKKKEKNSGWRRVSIGQKRCDCNRLRKIFQFVLMEKFLWSDPIVPSDTFPEHKQGTVQHVSETIL